MILGRYEIKVEGGQKLYAKCGRLDLLLFVQLKWFMVLGMRCLLVPRTHIGQLLADGFTWSALGIL